MKKLVFAVLFGIMVIFVNADTQETSTIVKLDNPVSQKGTVSFILETNKTYSNGYPDSSFDQTLFELPGLGKCIFERSMYAVFLYFQWEKDEAHNGFFALFKELSGPKRYAFQFSWDADKGLSDAYMNGIPIRTENDRYYKSWEVKGKTGQIVLHNGPNNVTDIKVLPVYTGKNETAKFVPDELYGKMTYLLNPQSLPEKKDISGRKGKLLYSSIFNNEDAMKDWVVEGPGHLEFQYDQLVMSSKIPNPPDGSTGHFNFWCPEKFPDKIIVEWEFMPLSEMGVCHIFFAAAGGNGEDIFDESLPGRDGHFQQYINDMINNYYIIYFSNRRLFRTTNFSTTWLMKCAKASLLTLGRTAVNPGEKRFYKMCLIKDGPHIQLLADGKVCLDYTDSDAEKNGPALESGRISFRQMAVTKAAYHGFKVWELRQRP